MKIGKSGNIKVGIKSSFGLNRFGVYVTSDNGQNKFHAIVKDGVMEFKLLESGKEVSCAFTIDGEDILIALSEAIRKMRFESPTDHKIEGTLEATRDHLKDMRKIAFNKLRLKEK